MFGMRQRYLTTDQVQGFGRQSQRKWPHPTTYRIVKGPTDIHQLDRAMHSRNDWEPLEFELESRLEMLRVRPYANGFTLDDLIVHEHALATVRRTIVGLVIPDQPLPVEPSSDRKIAQYMQTEVRQQPETGDIVGWEFMLRTYPLLLSKSQASIVESVIETVPNRNPD
jgi:hypothetical protein